MTKKIMKNEGMEIAAENRKGEERKCGGVKASEKDIEFRKLLPFYETSGSGA